MLLNKTPNKKKWDIVASSSATVAENMLCDTELLQAMELGAIGPTVRVYTWSKPGVTYGYLLNEEDIDSVTGKRRKINGNVDFDNCVARRPTGGGIVFHGLDEVAYCLVAPNDGVTMPRKLTEAYMTITRLIRDALVSLGYPVELKAVDDDASIGLKKNKSNMCFERAENYELVMGGLKVVGSAQRRTKKAILQQGTIRVANLCEVNLD